MSSTIIVSNRLPVSVKKTKNGLEFFTSAGGLATGLGSYAARRDSVWIGWPGIISDGLSLKELREITEGLKKYKCSPVFLTQKEVNEFYSGYSNALLWPYFHTLPADKKAGKHWRAYQDINARFAASVEEIADQDSSIWVHDYQLLLVPALLRLQRPRATIGFFLHIPFPAAEHFAALPHARELIRGMLGADLVGFHTDGYTKDFLDTCSTLRIGTPAKGGLATRGRPVRVTSFPIGIDYDKFALSGRSRSVQIAQRKLERKYKDASVILTVDRLDPTKGFIERLQAYRTMLEQSPKLHGNVIMVMLAVPSRSDVEAYRKLKSRVDKLVHDINDAYGTRSWQPVEYRYESVEFDELAALYRVADVAFVAPLRDGMNLVAKEFVASQSSHKGILVLSETAGAAEELRDALLVNPGKPKAMVRALTRALAMPKSEVRTRVKAMQDVLAANTIHPWANSFMRTLNYNNVRGLARIEGTMKLAFGVAGQRLLLFDYDGVLVPFAPTPGQAKPSAKLRSTLARLANTGNTDVAIISGRDGPTLEAWLGDINLTLIAEHGAKIKLPAGPWQELAETSDNWKKTVRPVLERYTRQTPGAFVEEKTYSLVWHYRNAAPYAAQKAIARMQTTLPSLLKPCGMRLYRGNMILEIKNPAINKGSAAKRMLTRHYDFIMAIGDDFTDEDMFAALPSDAWTIKVGPGRTAAKMRARDVNQIRALLNNLAG